MWSHELGTIAQESNMDVGIVNSLSRNPHTTSTSTSAATTAKVNNANSGNITSTAGAAAGGNDGAGDVSRSSARPTTGAVAAPSTVSKKRDRIEQDSNGESVLLCMPDASKHVLCRLKCTQIST